MRSYNVSSVALEASGLKRKDSAMMVADRLRCAGAIAVLALAATHFGWAQAASPTASSAPALVDPGPAGDAPPLDMQASQERLRSTARQKQLEADSDKLVAMANELKVAVDKSNKDTLSLDVIRKADAIEKLAHAVKEKMKGS
jgi:hypothetical protein